MAMAIATPAILPNPTVAESAVVSALKLETSPLSSGFLYLPKTNPIACPNPFILINPIRRVKKIPARNNHITTKGALVPISIPRKTKGSQNKTAEIISTKGTKASFIRLPIPREFSAAFK